MSASPATTPKPIDVATLDTRPNGALHIVVETVKGKSKTKAQVIARALCATRGELSPTRTTYVPESLLHPDNDDFDPTTSSICMACLEAYRAGTPTEAEVEDETPPSPEDRRLALQQAVAFMYDIQKQRIGSGNRAGPQAEHAPAKLDHKQATFMAHAAARLELLEADAAKEVKRQLAHHPIYEHWLEKQKGCGPLMSAVLIANVDIARCATVSQMWALCGLAVRSAPCPVCKGATGLSCKLCGGSGQTLQGDRRVKGQKAHYNPWLKSKVLAVLGTSFIKANSPWRKHYDDYKNRKKNERVAVCMLCNGTGEFKSKAPPQRFSDSTVAEVEAALGANDVEARADGKCPNCEGRGGDCPWGRSDKHRHMAAIRFMVKAFLREFYITWRTLENLPMRMPYAEEYLGRVHHEK